MLLPTVEPFAPRNPNPRKSKKNKSHKLKLLLINNIKKSNRALHPFDSRDGDIHHFDLLILSSPKTTNKWISIVGLVPTDFLFKGNKQWIGALDSWGYIGGTGGKVHTTGKSNPYGNKWGEAGI